MLNKDLLIKDILLSNAKVNIGINIFKKFSDGYHGLESLIQEISLSDTIQITILKSSGNIELSLKGIAINCNNSDNTCYKITDAFKKQYNIKNKIIIELDKKIPIGAGLGGGSSNAATILNFLNKAFNSRMNNKNKHKMCKNIGMDVPFFINGGLQYVDGRGDLTTPIEPLFNKFFFVIIYPQFSISTKWAYSKINKNLPSKKMRYNLLALKEPLNWNSFRNDFEDIVIPRYPEIRELKDAMLYNGAIYSSLSGSGSTVFGIYNDYNQALSLSKKINHKKYHITVTSPIYR